jgi:regulatory protein
MPIITGLETQQHDPERVSVFLDGKFAFGVSRILVIARHLVQGQELSDEEAGALERDDAVERAYSAALNFLSYRPRSRGEVGEYFRRKKQDPDTVRAVLERLDRAGLLDDQEFARYWVENRQTFRPRGSLALRTELLQKGVDREVIDTALALLDDEETTAYAAGVKKQRAFARLDEKAFFTKMVGFLQRRGFRYEAAAAATRKLYAERSADVDPDA